MINQTSNYALRAVIYLVEHIDECPIPGRVIAKGAGIPGPYLSQIMGDLVREGLLKATRGAGGGFRLARAAKDISLYDVLLRFEACLADERPCPFGNRICCDEDPCQSHEGWKKVRESFKRYLRRTSVRDAAGGRDRTRSANVRLNTR